MHGQKMMCESQQTGRKDDAGKPRFDLLDPAFLAQVAAVLAYGAEKYGEHNWRLGIATSRLFSAVQRHLWAFWGGEDDDPETGLSHLAHAACGLMFLHWTVAERRCCDDRVSTREQRDSDASIPAPGA
jgi:hypothetical protein